MTTFLIIFLLSLVFIDPNQPIGQWPLKAWIALVCIIIAAIVCFTSGVSLKLG